MILNVRDKYVYVVHIRTLKYYLQQGLILKKVNRCIKFKQKDFLKPYIDFNTEKRKGAKNEAEKDFFKLMNNSVFGKTMENVRGYVDYEIIDNVKRADKVLSQPNVKHRHIINENLIGVEKIREEVLLNE